MKSIARKITNTSDPYKAKITLSGDKVKRTDLENEYHRTLDSFKTLTGTDDDSALSVSYVISKAGEDVVVEVEWNSKNAAPDPTKNIFDENDALQRIMKDAEVAKKLVVENDKAMKPITRKITDTSDPYKAKITLSGDKVKRTDLENEYHRTLDSFKTLTGTDDDSALSVSYVISKAGEDVVVEVEWNSKNAAPDPTKNIFDENDALQRIMKDAEVAKKLVEEDSSQTTGENGGPGQTTGGNGGPGQTTGTNGGNGGPGQTTGTNGGSQSNGPGIAFQAFQSAFSGNADLWKAFQDGYNMAGGSKP